MSVQELALWSALQGVLFFGWLAALAIALRFSSAGAWLSPVYILLLMLGAGSLSGWLALVWPATQPYQQWLALLAAPLAGVLAVNTLARFLKSHRLDAFIQWGMRTASACWVLAAALAFWPRYQEALLYQCLASVLGLSIALWMATRTALLGDRLAWAMVGACAAAATHVLGIYGYALGYTDAWPSKVITALAMVIYLLLISYALNRRASQYIRMRRAVHRDPNKDLLTQLWTGTGFAQQIDAVMLRARRNRSTCAIVHLEIFNVPALRAEHGPYAVEEVIYTLAARTKQVTGAGAVVGRYGNYSFVVALSSVRSASVLRTLVLQLTKAARSTYFLRPHSAHPREFQADIGVGVVYVNAGARGDTSISPLGDDAGEESMQLAHAALHEAEELAALARGFSSRTAIYEKRGGPAKPIESTHI
jgi:GGDEF domain-containing protein